jgi:hypothetical protein
MISNGAYFFLPSPVSGEEPGTDITQALPGEDPGSAPVRLELGERILWRGHTNLAEHLYTDTMDGHTVRWTLPGLADVVVTDRRIGYASADGPGALYVASANRRPSRAVGHIRWHWPYHLYVCPGRLGSPAARPGGSDPDDLPAGVTGPEVDAPGGGRPAGPAHPQATRLLLVCGAPQAGGKPALVLFGGDLADLPAADALANTIRRAVAAFRLERAAQLGLTPVHAQALSRRLIGPDFANRLGGRAQAVTLPGALLYGFMTPAEYRMAAALTVAGLRAS